MNHRTPIEDFRARLAALSREQLEEAMHYLRGYNSFAMDRALELVSMPVAAAPAACPCGHPVSQHTKGGYCLNCDCTPDSDLSAEPDVIAGDCGPEIVNGGAK